MSTIASKFNDNDDYDEDEISFSLFQEGTTAVNLGLGTSAPSNLAFEATPKMTKQPVEPQEPVAPPETELTSKPPLEFIHEPELTPEPVPEPPSLTIYTDQAEAPGEMSDPVDLIAQSKKRFEEINSGLKSPIVPSLEVVDSSPKGSLTIDDVEEAQDYTPPLFDKFDQLSREYEKANTKVEKVVVYEDKVTAADRAGKVVNWWTQTFIVAPVRWVSRTLHNAVRDLLGSLLKILIFSLISVVATVGLYVVLAHFSTSGLSAYEMAMQHYNSVKGVVVTLYNDISESVRDNMVMEP